jgi:hypothetical protein
MGAVVGGEPGKLRYDGAVTPVELEFLKAGLQFVSVGLGVAGGWLLKERRTRLDRIQEARAEWVSGLHTYLEATRRVSMQAEWYTAAVTKNAMMTETARLEAEVDAAREAHAATQDVLRVRALKLRLLVPNDQASVKTMTDDALAIPWAKQHSVVAGICVFQRKRADDQVDAWATATLIHW